MEKLTVFQQDYLRPTISNSTRFAEKFDHYSLQKTPETLKGFVDLILSAVDGETFDRRRFVWVNADSFLTGCSLRGGNEFCYSIELVDGRMPYARLEVGSETERGALSILRMLFDANDTLYMFITIEAGNRCHLPWEDSLLEAIICQNQNRSTYFSNMEFRPENCRILATRGNSNTLMFSDCRFPEDDGDTFAQALRARTDEAVGPADLHFMSSFPERLIYDWGQYSSLDLYFSGINFNVRQGGALASARIRYLDFKDCRFEDGGQAIVDSVRAGRGPKGLGLDYSNVPFQPFDTYQRCLSFITALQGNQHLERLQLKCHHGQGVACAEALAGALRRNTTLIRLGFSFSEVVDGECWSTIFDAITEHPALCILVLGDLTGRQAGEDLTPTLVELAQKNSILERIYYSSRVCGSIVDQGVFFRWVVPQLECNKLRKRLVGIQNVKVQSRKAGVIANALARVNDMPSGIYMLLRPNMDSLVMAFWDRGSAIAAESS